MNCFISLILRKMNDFIDQFYVFTDFCNQSCEVFFIYSRMQKSQIIGI